MILALDTSTRITALGLGDPAGRLVAEGGPTIGTHGRFLVASIRDLLRTADVPPGRLAAIAVGLGPGSYTGLRVGLMAAKAIAYATGATLVGLDSLAVVAASAPPEAMRIDVVADAQRGDLSLASFRRDRRGGPIHKVGSTTIVAASAWLDGLAPSTFAAGPAVEGLADRVAWTHPEGSGLQAPAAVHLLAASLAAIEAGAAIDPMISEPTYPRRSAAEDAWEARRGGATA